MEPKKRSQFVGGNGFENRAAAEHQGALLFFQFFCLGECRSGFPVV